MFGNYTNNFPAYFIIFITLRIKSNGICQGGCDGNADRNRELLLGRGSLQDKRMVQGSCIRYKVQSSKLSMYRCGSVNINNRF